MTEEEEPFDIGLKLKSRLDVTKEKKEATQVCIYDSRTDLSVDSTRALVQNGWNRDCHQDFAFSNWTFVVSL